MHRLLRQFLQLESSSSIVLLAATCVAMIWVNSPLAFLQQKFSNAFSLIINEGLMTLFFLLVGLELKRGFVSGHLSNARQILLPLVAAMGGMLIPALIFLFINHHNPPILKGWPIPVATDIAFALGVLSLFGRRVPQELKLFLLALAIFDDIGAILIIAFYFAQGVSYAWLLLSGFILVILYILNKAAVYQLLPYLLLGSLLWISFFYGGIHPTLSGVLLAFMIPVKGDNMPGELLEKNLLSWSAYLVMPLFALTNAGFSLFDLSLGDLVDNLVLGIGLGLFVGKQLGVFGFSWLLIKYRLAHLPAKSSWFSLYGTSLLCGIGFTMSLFLGTLAFQNESRYLAEVRLGVMLGSLLSGLFGILALMVGLKQHQYQ